MKNKLSCEIIKDLLPLYVDKLVSEETKNAVDEHIEECEGCNSILEDIMPTEKDNHEDNIKQVDCLKKIRKKSKKRIIISIFLGIIFTLFGVLAMWAHGFPVSSSDLEYSTTVRGKDVFVKVKHVSDAQVITSLKFSEHNGIIDVSVCAHGVPMIFCANRTYERHHTYDTEISLVRMGETILWENGNEIDKKTSMLYASKNPYVGDISSDCKIADLLGVNEKFGTYKNKLTTNSKPYGWTLILEREIEDRQEEICIENMRVFSCAMMALIDNLDLVSWKYNVDGNSKTMTFSKEEVSNHCGKDIEKFGDSVSNFQELMDILGLTPKIKFNYRQYHLNK